MTKRETWPDEWDKEVDVRLIVRCRNRRLLAVSRGEPAAIRGLLPRRVELPVTAHVSVRVVLDGTRIHHALAAPIGGSDTIAGLVAGINDTRTFGDDDLGSPLVECPAHKAGHAIDGARLREAVELLCRPGKVASVDIGRVIARA
jgi:hypothetical protein